MNLKENVRSLSFKCKIMFKSFSETVYHSHSLLDKMIPSTNTRSFHMNTLKNRCKLFETILF